jgi:hypothetical protein
MIISISSMHRNFHFFYTCFTVSRKCNGTGPLANRGSRGSLPLALGEPPEANRVRPQGAVFIMKFGEGNEQRK